MRPAFRCGRIRACPNLLAVIDRPTLTAAIVKHATTQPAYDGQPMRTIYRNILLETSSTRELTFVSLI